MKLKCALSNEDIDYTFSDSDSLTFSFESNNEDDEIIFAKGNVVDIDPYIWQLIVVNVPLRVVKEGYSLENKQGKNWKIGVYEEEKEPAIDPRLESLKNYFDKR